jgi:hypothetical protein
MESSNVHASLDYLKRQRDEIDERLVGMSRLLKEREALDLAIKSLEEVLRFNSGGASDPGPLWQGARNILKGSIEPMSAKQIAEALTAMGWKLEGKTPIESIRTTLIRKPGVFERLDDGRFRLFGAKFFRHHNKMGSGGETGWITDQNPSINEGVDAKD